LKGLPLKKSRNYGTIDNGIVENTVYRQPHGIYCTNPAHQGSVCNVEMDVLICKICRKTGAPIVSLKKEMEFTEFDAATNLLSGVLRGSGFQIIKWFVIPKSVFDSLRETVIRNKK
jgi:hypothetical protein